MHLDQQNQQFLQFPNKRYEDDFILNQKSVQFIKNFDIKKILKLEPNSSKDSKQTEQYAFNSVVCKQHPHEQLDQ